MTELITNLRKATADDLEEIRTICDVCFPGDDAFEIAESLIEIEHYYVAFDEHSKKIIGFVIFGIYSVDTAHIMIFAVHPNYQKKGVGSKILAFAIKIIKESTVEKVRLEVKIQNEQAIHFYKKRGFVIKGLLKEYYDDLSDGYLMIKEL